MITPSPTTKLAPNLARGIYRGTTKPTATKPALMVIEIPDTSYKLHLVPNGTTSVKEGKRIVGNIAATARRIDATGAGGRYVEPVFGPPQRLQGSVIATDEANRTVTVKCAVPFTLTLTHPKNSPAQFNPGDLVACDLEEGATFTPDA